MPTVVVTQLVPASVDAIWQVFTDLPGRAAWSSTVDAIRVLTSGPFDVGTRWEEVHVLPGGTAVTEEFLVTAIEPRTGCTVTSAGIGADYRITYTFTPVEVGRHRGGTSMTVVQEGRPTAPYGRLLALMFGGLAVRTVEGAWRRELAELGAAARTLRGPGGALADGPRAEAA